MIRSPMRQRLALRLFCSFRCPRSWRSTLRVPIFHTVRSVFTSSPQLLAQVRSERDGFPELWFSSSSPHHSEGKPQPNLQEIGNDERTLKLGKSESPVHLLFFNPRRDTSI